MIRATVVVDKNLKSATGNNSTTHPLALVEIGYQCPSERAVFWWIQKSIIPY